MNGQLLNDSLTVAVVGHERRRKMRAMRMKPDLKTLLTAGDDGVVKIWELDVAEVLSIPSPDSRLLHPIQLQVRR